MATELFLHIKRTFDKNQESVRELLHFDRIILDFCLGQMETLEHRLKNNSEINITNLHLLPSTTINALRQVRENDSLRVQYESMFNQSLVLAVSHFSSTLHSIFKEAVDQACCCCPNLLTATSEDIKITFDELKIYHFDLTNGLGELIIKKKDISFQDMQSTQRAFKTFFNLNLEKDSITHDIILAQAARHSIVHAEGIADEKFIKQIKDANPRTVKPNVEPESKLQFLTEEIEQIQASMTNYIDRLIDKLEDRILKNIEIDLGEFHDDNTEV